MYFELFVAAALPCLGEIGFGRFEEGSPRLRRILEMSVFFGVTALLSRFAGRAAAPAWVFGVHAWRTRRNGIGVFSPEPWDRYRALRGWG